jgi:3-oxoacyl-[acyl-carrier-protein] synthase-3
MQFENVSVESIGFSLPSEIVTSSDIESSLSKVYERLSLPPGRLEWMSGVGQRRLWPVGFRVSDASVRSGDAAIEAAGIAREKIGVLIHASVCRDYLEPATASRVHHLLGLSESCIVYDVSNACLGLLNGMIQIATAIEAGIIEAGLVVGTESSRNLLEATIKMLSTRDDITRQTIKPSFASLTIGSGSCGVLLTHRNISRHDNRLHTAVAQANTSYHDLCHSDEDQAGSGMTPLMETDSEQLLVAGIATGKAAFERFCQVIADEREGVHRNCVEGVGKIERTICHQVGSAHRKLMLQTLGLSQENDYATYPWLGNTGSVALPLTLAMASKTSFIQSGQETALLGIGSGINSLMMGVKVNHLPVAGELDVAALQALSLCGDIAKASMSSGSAKPPHIPLAGYKQVVEQP